MLGEYHRTQDMIIKTQKTRLRHYWAMIRTEKQYEYYVRSGKAVPTTIRKAYNLAKKRLDAEDNKLIKLEKKQARLYTKMTSKDRQFT